MADLNQQLARTSRAGAGAIDVGLRAYMLRVYNYMALGLALTGAVAFLTFSNPSFYQAIFATPLAWVVMLAPLGFVMVLSFGIRRLSAGTAQVLFWVFAGVMGLSLSSIFFAYAHSDIARVFFITAASFGALSLWGYTTQRDLTAFGSFLFIGLVGLVIAMVVNIFLHSSGLDFALSVVGVLIFAGLTAYDTQRIKSMYMEGLDGEVATKTAVMGALALYLDFINMFLMLLRLMGSNRS
jgi:FtsH-binding integral membrane protein